MTETYTFPNTEAGLVHVINTTLHLRSFGHRTRLAVRRIGPTTVLTVVSTPPARPPRTVRLAGFHNAR